MVRQPKILRERQKPPCAATQGVGRVSPNLRSADRPLLGGRAMIHLGIKVVVRVRNFNSYAGGIHQSCVSISIKTHFLIYGIHSIDFVHPNLLLRFSAWIALNDSPFWKRRRSGHSSGRSLILRISAGRQSRPGHEKAPAGRRGWASQSSDLRRILIQNQGAEHRETTKMTDTTMNTWTG